MGIKIILKRSRTSFRNNKDGVACSLHFYLYLLEVRPEVVLGQNGDACSPGRQRFPLRNRSIGCGHTTWQREENTVPYNFILCHQVNNPQGELTQSCR